MPRTSHAEPDLSTLSRRQDTANEPVSSPEHDVRSLIAFATKNYTMSYKGVTMLAILDCLRPDGTASIDEITRHVIDYYSARKEAGLPVEKPTSVMYHIVTGKMSLPEARSLLLRYPLEILARTGLFTIHGDTLRAEPSVASVLRDQSAVRRIRLEVERALAAYFKRLEKRN